MNDLRLLAKQLSPDLLSVMRIIVAFLFMTHGSVKLFGIPSAQPTDPVSWLSQMGTAGMLEFLADHC